MHISPVDVDQHVLVTPLSNFYYRRASDGRGKILVDAADMIKADLSLAGANDRVIAAARGTREILRKCVAGPGG